MTSQDLARAFPTAESVPEAWRWQADDAALTLLIGGRLSRGAGPSGVIRSAVGLRQKDGSLAPLDLGPMALASSAEALEAVRAASSAWAGGRGEWPRAKVETRIRCVTEFLDRMRPLRERVAR